MDTCGATDGYRVQTLVVRASDVADTTAEMKSYVPAVMNGVDKVFADSAAKTGGSRNVRWVKNADCTYNVQAVTVAPEADDTFGATVAAVRAAGHTRTDRKYMMLVDAKVYCGIASIQHDDRPSQDNANNVGAGYSRMDRGCWSSSVTAHELMHNIGGVQLSAPHSDGGWHCNTEWDRMCYGGTQTVVCSDGAQDRLFDCGNDDYFSTRRGNPYLDTHWNTANSAWLLGAVGPSPTPSPLPAPSPTLVSPQPSPNPSPSPTKNCFKVIVRICR